MITEQQLQNWSRALSETENARCVSTVTAIREILQKRFGNSVDVFLQGSYKNSTNIRVDSDVDIVVCYTDAYFSDLSGLSEQDKDHHNRLNIDHDYSFPQFKNDVEVLMREKFPNDVERKNKCIFVKGNTYRVAADIVPCFKFKRFRSPYHIEAEGIKLISDRNKGIESFPSQHYNNGVTKNKNTNTLFKSVIRILKNARNILIDKGIIDKNLIPSFFLECLVWNVPNKHFDKYSNKDQVNSIIEVLWSDMDSEEKINCYAEVSNLMWLFRGQTEKTPEMAKRFIEVSYNLINS